MDLVIYVFSWLVFVRKDYKNYYLPVYSPLFQYNIEDRLSIFVDLPVLSQRPLSSVDSDVAGTARKQPFIEVMRF